MKKLTVPMIKMHKTQPDAVPLVMLTAYTAPMAKLLDPHVDILLVGDSLGMVVYGMPNTLGVTLDMMQRHGKAVADYAQHALVVVDLPFGSYQQSPQQAFANSAELMAASHCAAVKLEGGVEMAQTVAFLVERGIPVMGHVGLMPQRVHTMGGYKYQGRNDEEAQGILKDALAIEKAGAFAIVLEGVKEDVARTIAKRLHIPTIGIGASSACDGQVLVVDDMLGISASGYVPGFVKQYTKLGDAIEHAVQQYAKEVQSRKFPSEDYCFPFTKKSH